MFILFVCVCLQYSHANVYRYVSIGAVRVCKYTFVQYMNIGACDSVRSVADSVSLLGWHLCQSDCLLSVPTQN